MADEVIVYNKDGIALGELDVSVVREYRAESTIQVGRGSFSISANSNKATRALLEYNNIVVVRSNLGIPDWAGIIWTPTIIKNGQITVNLRAAEWMLGQRFILELGYNSISPGVLFRAILTQALNRGPLPISDDWSGIDDSGTADLDGEFIELSCYDAANTLASQAGYYWYFSPSPRAQNTELEFKPFFTSQIGRVFTKPLIANAKLLDVELQEVGDIANNLTVYARIPSYTEPVIATARDEDSIGRFGLVDDVDSNLTLSNASGVQVVADKYLQERAFPFLRISGTVTTRPFPTAGDLVPVELGLGYRYLGRKSTLYCRVKTSRYDPIANSMTVVMDEEISNDVEQ